jgi:hypothetical protein
MCNLFVLLTILLKHPLKCIVSKVSGIPFLKSPRVQDTIIVALPFSLEAQPLKWMIINQLMDDYRQAYCHSAFFILCNA